MNKSVISIIVSCVLLIGVILSAVLFAGFCKSPEGLSSLEGVLDGCNKKSEKAIMSNFASTEYAASFSSCVTSDDYLKRCGISFDYMSNENNVTEKFYLVGAAAESEDTEKANNFLSAVSSGYKMVEAYIAADYKGTDGNTHTAMTTVTLAVKDGKIVYIG